MTLTTNQDPEAQPSAAVQEPEPPLRSWAKTYGLVLASAVLWIALLWWLTEFATSGQ